MASPHGSKFKELIRFLANRFLTDGQRKKIKNALITLQQMPVRMLGIQDLLDAQYAEIVRLKSRLTLVDGKLNVALYGMPRIDEYRAQLLSNSLVAQLEVPTALTSVRVGDASIDEDWSRKILSAPMLDGFQPSRGLVIGLEPGTMTLLEALPSISEMVRADLEDRPDVSKGQFVQADPINALLASGEASWDLIACVHRYHLLSPQEQPAFLHLAISKLSPRGVCLIIAPDLSFDAVAHDYYWSQPKNLRPYSISHLAAMLNTFEGTHEILKQPSGGRMLAVIFRKAGTSG
jgi:hypothetical protein